MRGRDISVVFQEPMTALNPIYTVGQQIVESLELHTPLRGAGAWREAIAAMRRVGVDEPERRARSYPHQLSGGQRQRAMIAMALACNPKLLIADEPTTALDVAIRLQILELLEDLRAQAGMALLLITHDLNLVRRFADRVAVMEQGVLVEQGRTADVIERPQHPYTKKLVASRPDRNVAAPASGRVVSARDVVVNYPTSLPGIRGWAIAMPDVHEGYGFPIGGIAAVGSDDGVISPGGIGYDINCGVRLLRSSQNAISIRAHIPKLVHSIAREIPSGVGRGGSLRFKKNDLDEVLRSGASRAVEIGFGEPADLDRIESRGAIDGEANCRVCL